MKALAGKKILVTRPTHQAEPLCRLIEAEGAVALRWPAIKLVATGNLEEVRKTLESCNNYQWLVFVSANAVNFALSAISGTIARLHAVRIAAIGKATAKALETCGLTPDLTPDQGFNSEALLAMPMMQQLAGSRILIVRGEGGREALAEGFRTRGASVDYLNVYRRTQPTADWSTPIEWFENDSVDVVTATSGEILDNLTRMLGVGKDHRLMTLPLVVISPRLAELAAEMGFQHVLVATGPGDAAILETIITSCTTGEQCGRSE